MSLGLYMEKVRKGFRRKCYLHPTPVYISLEPSFTLQQPCLLHLHFVYLSKEILKQTKKPSCYKGRLVKGGCGDKVNRGRNPNFIGKTSG